MTKSYKKREPEGIDLDEIMESIMSLPVYLQIMAFGFITYIAGLFVEVINPNYSILIYATLIPLIIAYYGYNIYKLKDNKEELIKYLFQAPQRKKKTGRLVPNLTREEKEHVLELFGYQCAVPNCYETEALEIHHIIPATEEGTSNDINNLIVLCPTHHAKVNIWGRSKLRYWAKEARKKTRRYR